MPAYPPPGRLFDIGGRRLHLYERGERGATVVLESGLAATSLSWRPVQNELEKFARVISYDRAGLGWSDSAPTPPTLTRLTDDLHALLRTASPPFVLVGHSFGALIVRAYAQRFGEDVSGLVLVDPLRPEEWSPLSADKGCLLARGVRLSRRGASLARAGVVGWCLRSLLAGSRWLPRMVGGAASGRGLTLMSRLAGEVAKLPRELWPMVAQHWSDPQSFLAMAAQLETLPQCAAETVAIPAHIPTVTLTAPHHWIQLDEPRRVVDAVSSLLDKSPGRR